MADPADPARPSDRGALIEAFRYTADRDRLLIPYVVAAELAATGLTALMVVLWHPLFIVLGLLLAVVAPLVALNLRMRRLVGNAADERRPEGSADLP
jgi:hypothetical protein